MPDPRDWMANLTRRGPLSDGAFLIAENTRLRGFIRWIAEDYFEGACDCDGDEVCLMHRCRESLGLNQKLDSE